MSYFNKKLNIIYSKIFNKHTSIIFQMDLISMIEDCSDILTIFQYLNVMDLFVFHRTCKFFHDNLKLPQTYRYDILQEFFTKMKEIFINSYSQDPDKYGRYHAKKRGTVYLFPREFYPIRIKLSHNSNYQYYYEGISIHVDQQPYFIKDGHQVKGHIRFYKKSLRFKGDFTNGFKIYWDIFEGYYLKERKYQCSVKFVGDRAVITK